jgi:hypothetical protein
MPITITVKDFKDKTSHPIFQRPGDLISATNYLRRYHIAKHHPNSDAVRECAANITNHIERWAKGKKKKVVNGRERYRDWRDRTGIISELERQASRTFDEIVAYRRAMVDEIYDRFQNPTRTLNIAPEPQPPAVPERRPHSVGPAAVPALPPRRVRPKPPVALRLSTESFDSAPFRTSLRSNLAETVISFDRTTATLDPWYPEPRRAADPVSNHLHTDCYRTVAELIRMSTGQMAQASAVKAAVKQTSTATGSMISSWVTMQDIFQALQHLGHDVAYVQHCTWNQSVNMIMNTRDNSPALVCVGDGGMLNRVILCHGVQYTGDGTEQETGFLVKDHRVMPGNALLYLNGDYDVTVNGVAEHSALLPSLGYIKFKR